MEPLGILISIEGSSRLNGTSGNTGFEVPWIFHSSVLVLERHRGITVIYGIDQLLFQSGPYIPQPWVSLHNQYEDLKG